MNRRDLQQLAGIRLREARVLLRAGEFSGAYYLAGYAVECALKARIARQYKRHDFPDKKTVNDSYSHDLRKLANIARIDQARLRRSNNDDFFRKNWDLVTIWSEESRYRAASRTACHALLNAIMNKEHGVLPWLKERW